jgi:hypothetical protein
MIPQAEDSEQKLSSASKKSTADKQTTVKVEGLKNVKGA